MKTYRNILWGAALAIATLASCVKGNDAKLTVSGLDPAAFDTTINEKPVKLYTLKNSNGMEVCITNFGGRVVSLCVPDKDGKPTDAVTYYYAKAVIVGDTIELTCPQVKEAFGVRYAWFDLDLGWNVVNGAGLPLGVLRVFKDGKYHSQAK